jgi:hypothetical protein
LQDEAGKIIEEIERILELSCAMRLVQLPQRGKLWSVRGGPGGAQVFQ